MTQQESQPRTPENPEYRVIVLTVRMSTTDPDEIDEIFDEYHSTDHTGKSATQAYRLCTELLNSEIRADLFN